MPVPRPARLLPLLAAALLLPACASTPATEPAPTVVSTSVAVTLPVVDGRTGDPMAWGDLVARAADADIVVLGEIHNDAAGHAVQLALLQAVLAEPGRTALALEMLERDEQALVQDYVEGIIDAEQFATLTFSTRWGGAEGTWAGWYQPMVDATKDAGGTIVAANAPRRYVRLARTGGYEALDAIGPPRDALFDRPDELPEGEYRRRFAEAMGVTHDDDMSGDGEEDAPWLEAMFRSQMVWDVTMAESVADARESGADRVLLMIGQFHADFEGGTVAHLRERRPNDEILVVSLQPVVADALREDDAGRADVVVFTGLR